MVDGLLKSFDEFRNGCDEKAAVYRDKYRAGVLLSRVVEAQAHLFLT